MRMSELFINERVRFSNFFFFLMALPNDGFSQTIVKLYSTDNKCEYLYLCVQNALKIFACCTNTKSFSREVFFTLKMNFSFIFALFLQI